MNQETLDMFKTLTEFPSAPGFERELRAYVKDAMTPYTEEFVQDRLGSLFGVLRGEENGPKIMVAGHFDEVGFMVTGITNTGMIRFQPLGGWLASAVASQRLHIITPKGTLTGVVGSTPIHLLSNEERGKTGEISKMYIDIGADSREEAESFGVRPGQQVLPICPFTPLANPKKSWRKLGITVTA